MTPPDHAHSVAPIRLHRNRRGFFKLAGAGAATVLVTHEGLASPRRAAAAGKAEALLLNCIDFRLIRHVTTFVDSRGLSGEFDQVVLAGASLGAQNDDFPEWSKTWWDHLELAIQLHSIERVIVVDHRDCGAYKLAFGVDFAQDPAAETEIHTVELTALRAAIEARHPELEVELFLMALDGTVEAIGLKG